MEKVIKKIRRVHVFHKPVQQRTTNRFLSIIIAFFLLISIFFSVASTNAQSNKGFSLQVTPSPIIATITPGEVTNLVLNIKNTSTESETLKMGLKSFSVDKNTGDVVLGNDDPADVKDFVTFADPVFGIEPGQWFDQKIRVDTPVEAGFSYSFAITISRSRPAENNTGASKVEGSVAVFALFGVDRPGAVRKFELEEMKASKKVYEYLPADITLTFKNSGNTLVQPKGTLFLQRSSNDSEPLEAISINKENGYMLPGTSRKFVSSWSDSFPHFETNKKDSSKKSLVWNFANISHIRIGKYTAKLVSVYDDGERDVPITGEVTFWVIPWKLLIASLFVIVILGIGLWTVLKKSRIIFKKKSDENKKD